MSTSNTKTAKHYFESQKPAYICIYIYVSMHIVNFTWSISHTCQITVNFTWSISHTCQITCIRIYPNAFMHPKCHVLKRHCNDCIQTLAYILTHLSITYFVPDHEWIIQMAQPQPILMQESFWWWQCNIRYSPPFRLPPLISVLSSTILETTRC